MVELLNQTREQLVEELQKKEASRAKLKEKLVLSLHKHMLLLLSTPTLHHPAQPAGTAERAVCEYSTGLTAQS